MRFVLILVLVLIAAGMAYIRLAPSDPAVWHVAPETREPGEYPGEGSFMAVVEAGEEALADLDAVAVATPRTQRLAGAPEDGMVTWVTRSRVMGFPDYTTAIHRDGLLTVEGRLRFGRSDMGVNQARIEGWLEEAGI
ncbi:DUF1499 domain-containing protein [Aestuariibius sp. 2305UL40-4]|uniref:DUF1499 domain-containing protein n=1 Tax=Aestuariibius violaceus TaxID=3234132 RepID=UPI00345E0A33